MKSRTGFRRVLGATVVGVVAGAIALTLILNQRAPSPRRPEPWPTDEQRYVMDQLVAVYENTETTPQYGFIVDHHDGCGYTAGWVGFCTATGDLLEVVDFYTSMAPENPLRKYLPELKRLAASGSASVDGLPDFPTAWRRAADDARFRRAQNEVADRLYFEPAVGLAKKAGLRSALAVAIFFETAIQHGAGPDPDGLPALIARTEQITGGRPRAGVSETSWLTTFNHVRSEDLLDPHNRDRLATWPDSVDRSRSNQRLVDGGHSNLSGRIPVQVFGGTFTIGR